MSVLTDRASLLRAFERLMAVDTDTDTAVTEHDSSTLEGVYQLLQYGAWDAQHYMLDCGLNDRWVTTSSALTFTSADDGQNTSLPSDFIRLAGNDNTSALREADGTRWGKLIPFEDRWQYANSNAKVYYLRNEELWVPESTSVPSDLRMDYHHRLATLADGTTVDFPTEHRALIVSFAGMRAINEGWVPSQEVESRVQRKLAFEKQQAWKFARRSAGPRKFRTERMIGTHWIVGR